MRAAARSRRPPVERVPDYAPEVAADAAPRRSAAGCLLRLVMGVVFLFVLLAGAIFVFGGMLLQMFERY